MNALSRFLSNVHDRASTPDVFNLWRDCDPLNDLETKSPEHRFDHLTRYMTERIGSAKLLLIAEAPGFRGAKFSGLAMSSERRILESCDYNSKPYFTGKKFRTSKLQLSNEKNNSDGSLEPTASIVWDRMLGLMDSHDFVLWNSFAWQPHHPDNMLTNRTPTEHEIASGLDTLQAFLDAFPNRQVVAVGKKCEGALRALGVDAEAVRHPANGGANKFRDGISEILKQENHQLASTGSSCPE